MDLLLGWNVDAGFQQRGNDFSIFLRSNDVDLDVLHDVNKVAYILDITSFRKI